MYYDTIGLKVKAAAGGASEVALEISDAVLNIRGVVHGGAISSLLDVAIGQALMTAVPENHAVSTIDLHVNFLSGAKGEAIVARGQTVKVNRNFATGSAQAFDAEGKLVAQAVGVFAVLAPRS